MSDVFDELRKVLERSAFQVCAAAGIPDVNIDGYPFQQPDNAPFVTFYFETGMSFLTEVGAQSRALSNGLGRERTVGYMQFEINVPEKTGNGPATKMGDAVRRAFRLQQFTIADCGYVTIGTGSVSPAESDKSGWKCFHLRLPFDYRHDG